MGEHPFTSILQHTCVQNNSVCMFNVALAKRACASPFLLAACGAVAVFATDDTLRAVLLRERSALGEAVMQLTSAAWDEAEDPSVNWAMGLHVSSRAPALAAVLLGDVESEGAHGGVALSSAAVAAVAGAFVVVMARPSSSGSHIWHVSPPALSACILTHPRAFAKPAPPNDPAGLRCTRCRACPSPIPTRRTC